MARVFDNTDASCSTKKLELKKIWAKLDLLNVSFYITYGLKFKIINKNCRYYHLVKSFDTKDTSELSLYQTGKEVYWKKGKDMQYGYSKLLLNELLLNNFSSSSNVDIIYIAEDI